MPKTNIAIVGGGIAGLYCLYQLARLKIANGDPRYELTLFESAANVGGRISTHRIYSGGKDIEESNEPRQKKLKDLDFYQEYGPMRIEPDQQPLLKQLLESINIKYLDGDRQADAIEANQPFLVGFAKYRSRVSSDRTYQLFGSESEQETAMELLKLFLLRVFLRTDPYTDKELRAFSKNNLKKGGKRRCHDLIGSLRASVKTTDFKFDELLLRTSFHEHHKLWKNSLELWIKDLNEKDYQDFRECLKIDRVFLHDMGFWNLLSDLMSHNAATKMSELGSFYHLIPENPNAIEWIIFWLRALKTTDNLRGVFGGMQCIVDELIEKIKNEKVDVSQIKTLHKLESMYAEEHKVKLIFNNNEHYETFDHVILALPNLPLKTLALKSYNGNVFTDEAIKDIDSVFGFPMTKCFVGVSKAWWRMYGEDEEMANEAALQLPTREVHYCTSQKFRQKENVKNYEDCPQGMILAYADRPASAFWGNYVESPDEQVKPEVWPGKSTGQKNQKNQRLVKKLLHIIRENAPKSLMFKLDTRGKSEFNEEDIIFYGIRDWGREPYGAANHSWRPERKSWEIQDRLSAIKIIGEAEASVHVCGEAYSDYQGFIEGALRSAVYILNRIDRGVMEQLKKDLAAVDEDPDELVQWVNRFR